MNRDEEFLKAVSERKAPMALIPEDVVEAVAKISIRFVAFMHSSPGAA